MNYTYRTTFISNIYFTSLRFPNSGKMNSQLGWVEGSAGTIGYWNTEFLRDVSIDPLLGSGLSSKWRNVLLQFFSLLSKLLFLHEPPLIPNHFQVFNLSLWCGGNAFLKILFAFFVNKLQLFLFLRKFDGSCLEH